MSNDILNFMGIGQTGGYSNPADSGMQYLNQIAGTVTPYYQPYINAGQDTLSSLMDQYGQLVANPSQKYNDLGAGYTQSPGYQYNYNQGMNAANSAAQAGGMAGTPYHQQNAASMASNLAAQDYDTYMKQVTGLYNTGLSGQSGINQMGYNASDALANQLSASLMNQANMAYAGTNNQNAANQQGNSNMWNMIGAGIGALF